MVVIAESYRRGHRGFYIQGSPEHGYWVRATGNNRVLHDLDLELKTLQDARNWLTEWYPGVILES